MSTPIFTPGELKRLLPTMTDLNLRSGDKVIVAMSGGVDSSVALRILADMPVHLYVVFMKNWDSQLSETLDPGPSSQPPDLSYASSNKVQSTCEWEKDWADVQAVAAHIGIKPNRVQMLDFTKEYWNEVFEPAVQMWKEGKTPNPDVECNRRIKFGALFDKVIGSNEGKENRKILATGHYARIVRTYPYTRLCRASDLSKDQSYYLSGISLDQLKNTCFPLGKIKKVFVRKLAKHWGLPTADREESMGVCFIGERNNFGEFVGQYITPPETQGNIVDLEGNILQQHNGLWNYTIGQKARLAGMEEKWFVAKKGLGPAGQDILVVPGGLQCISAVTEPFHLIDDHWLGKQRNFRSALIQIRHRMTAVKAETRINPDGSFRCDFSEPVVGVAPGQVLAAYYGPWCIGNGVIRDTVVLGERLTHRGFGKAEWESVPAEKRDEAYWKSVVK